MFCIRKFFIYLLCLELLGTVILPRSAQARNLPGYRYNFLVVLADEEGSKSAQGSNDKNSDSSSKLSEQKEKKLKSLIEGEAKQQGLVTGIVNGVVFLYSSISDLLLHPILTIVISILTVGLIILVTYIFVLFRREDFSALGKLVSFGILYFLIYIDLLFINYEYKRITLMFFSLDKDIILVVIATVVGYFIGRYSSRQVFEEKVLP